MSRDRTSCAAFLYQVLRYEVQQFQLFPSERPANVKKNNWSTTDQNKGNDIMNSHRKFWAFSAVHAVVVSATLLCSTNFTFAEDDLLTDVKERGVLKVGTEARFAPFEFVEDGKIVGYSSDIMAEIMKAFPGVELDRLDLPWQGILPGLAAKRFDYVVTSVTVTKEILVQLLIVFYFLPTVGISIPPVLAAIIALTLNTAAFQAEIYRAGLQAIPRGQIEAARTLGIDTRSIRARILV